VREKSAWSAVRDPLAGALMVCRGCGAGNGRDSQHCAKCGASLRDAVPIRGAGDFGNDAGRAWHQALVLRHRRWSVAAALTVATGIQATIGGLTGGWLNAAAHGAVALAVIALVAWRRWGHLPAMALGGAGTVGLWMHAPSIPALLCLPVQIALYAWIGSGLRSTSDLTDG
jgi:hypothetical protein